MSLAQQAVAELKSAQEYFNRSTRGLTEEHSGLMPAPGMMTAAQQVAHAAQTIEWLIAGAFDPKGFRAFLAEQSDLGTKWAPRYVRIASELPVTATNKIVKRELRRERWECAEPVWVRADGGYRPLDPSGVEDIRREFAARDRGSILDSWT